ncbi:MAG: glycosyltransferase [Candidatus Electryoneaceae bacterium]|nr:glycosyltransferase [Candidatus Electryoneaceae bacterium]
MAKTRLLYITYNENILESGILHGQVRRMLEYMAKRRDVEYIRLVSFISPRLWWRRRNGYEQLARQMADAGIDFRVQWMLAAQKWLWFAIPIIVGFCLPMVVLHLLKGRFDVVHTRGYGAGLLGSIATRDTGEKFIFDTRGEFPEEMALNGLWHESGLTYRLWKILERWMVHSADVVVGVTPVFRDRYLAQGAEHALFVPNRGDVIRFSKARKSPPADRPILLFTGEMDSVWNSPQRVGRCYHAFKQFIPNLRLKIITHKDTSFVRREFATCEVNEEDYTVESSPPEEMPEKIAGSTFGLVLAIRSTGNWPVKFVEYLASGIPVIVDRNVGKHITKPVENERLGMVINVDDLSNGHEVLALFQAQEQYADRCINYARMNLDLSQTAAQYAGLYKS